MFSRMLIRRRLLWSILIILIVAGIAGTGVYFWRQHEKMRPFANGRLGVIVSRSMDRKGFEALAKQINSTALISRRISYQSARRSFMAQKFTAQAADYARRQNASVLLALDEKASSDEALKLLLYFRLPESTREVPRPDLQRLDSMLVYPASLEIALHSQTEWAAVGALIQSHLLLCAAYGSTIPTVLKAGIPFALEDAQAAAINEMAGTLAFASAVGGGAGSKALDAGIAFLSKANEQWKKNGNTNHATACATNLSSALFLRGNAADVQLAQRICDSLKADLPKQPDESTKVLASYVQMQLALARTPSTPQGKATDQSILSDADQLQKHWTPAAHPYAWAAVEMLKARAWSALADSGDVSAIDKAIQVNANAQKVFTRNPYPGEWANAQSEMASLYARRRSGDANENARIAAEYYQKALQVWSPKTTPAQWGRDMIALASVRLIIKSDSREALIKQSIKELEQAREVFTPEANPAEWGRLYNTLGVAWHNLPHTRERDEKAIECYKEALKVRTIEAMPAEASQTLMNLGNAYRDFDALDAAEKKDFLNLALKAYDAADAALEHTLNRRAKVEIEKNRKQAQTMLQELM